MAQLPYPLEFMHKFNLHKWLRLDMRDDDLPAIARIYGVGRGRLARIDRGYRQNVDRLAASLPRRAEPPLGELEKPARILALGDSITSDRESWARILARYWREDPKRRVLDSAVSGDTTASLLERYHSTVGNQEFDWVVLFIGTNDCRQLDGKTPMVSLGEYRRNLEILLDRLAGKRIVLVTLPPADNARFQAFFPDSGNRYEAGHLAEANRVLRELAARRQLALADLAAGLEPLGAEALESDGLHMSSAGQLVLCRLLLAILP
jgi:lysophospholipase L1-like esterase